MTHRDAFFALVALGAISLPGLCACGPGDNCEVTATCSRGQGGQGGAGASGASGPGGATTDGGAGPGGSGPGGSGGGMPTTCGNGTVDAGEVCFGADPIAYPTTKEAAMALALGDCDKDGDLDVITADRDSITITALKNDGTGKFVEATSSPVTSIPPLDLATAEVGGSMAVVVSYVGGGYTDTFVTPDDCTFTASHWFYHSSSSNSASSATVVDIDGQGDPDVVVAINDTIAFATDGTGNATELSSFTTQPLGLSTGDVNDDGLDDVLYADFANNLLRWGVGTGSGLTISFNGEATGTGPAAVAVGDLDADGNDDVVVAHATANSVGVFKSNGTTNVSFTKVLNDATISSNNGVPALAPSAIALGDVDSDGDLDAITANSSDSQGTSSVSLLLNDGTGTLTLAAGFPKPVGRHPMDIALRDLNDDGALDVVTAHEHVEQATSHINVILANP